MDQPRLHWFCPHATPYHDYVFTSLARRIPGFGVVFGSGQLASHPWKSALGRGFPSRVSGRLLGVDWRSVLLPVHDRRALFVVVGWNTGTLLLLLAALRLMRRRYVVWTDTPEMRRRGPAWRERARSAFVRWIFSGAQAVMGTGRPGVEALAAMGADPRRLIAFPFFLDLAAFRRSGWERDPAAPVSFVSSGRVLNSLKGHDVAIRALAKASIATGRPFRYLIAGTGPDVERVQALARDLGIADSVRMLGWTEPEELRGLMRTSDALIHPSPTPDPFPNAVLEGMAAGMVVFGSDVSGSALDRIDHGENGFIHRAGDADHLAGQLAELLRDPGLAARMGPRAAARAQEWPVERGVAIIEGLFEGRLPAISPGTPARMPASP